MPKASTASITAFTRCVRRAWLCGVDPLTKVDHDQRKLMVEARTRELGSIFAVGIYVYAYVDLNPLRATIATNVEASDYTSVQLRANELRKSPEKANDTLRPIVGLSVFLLPMTEAQYIELVDKSAPKSAAPLRNRRLGLDPDHWTGQVKGIGSAYWRIVGTAEAIMAKAEAIGQEWMKGIGYARWLERFI